MKTIVHVFNSSIVSGPETLVIPALVNYPGKAIVVFLAEARREAEAQGPIEYARKLGLETHTVRVRSRADFLAIRELFKLLSELKPQVAHSHDVKASTYLLRAARQDKSRPYRIFSTHHGVRGRSGWKSKLYEKFYSRFILPGFDRVLTVCNSDHRLLAERGVPERILRTHLNGVDRPEIAPGDRERESRRLRASWGIPEKGVNTQAQLLGFVGRIAPEKRLDRILEVCKELDALEPGRDWALIAFGTGPLEKELQNLASSLKIAHRVRWMGYRSGLGKELAGFDVLLSLSDAEGLPINLIEAGWAGTPVFATAVDGNLDLIPSRAEGWLFPVGRSSAEIARELLELLRNSELRQKMGAKFQERVRAQFSGKRWLAELERLYEET